MADDLHNKLTVDVCKAIQQINNLFEVTPFITLEPIAQMVAAELMVEVAWHLNSDVEESDVLSTNSGRYFPNWFSWPLYNRKDIMDWFGPLIEDDDL